jgi:hypothetical protein
VEVRVVVVEVRVVVKKLLKEVYAPEKILLKVMVVFQTPAKP